MIHEIWGSQEAFRQLAAALRESETPEAARAAAEWGLNLGVLHAACDDQRMMTGLMLGLQDNKHAVEGAFPFYPPPLPHLPLPALA